MTPERSKNLKVGTRVCFNGVRSDGGKVAAIQARYIYKWDDGHESFTGYGDMKRVESVSAKPNGANKMKWKTRRSTKALTSTSFRVSNLGLEMVRVN